MNISAATSTPTPRLRSSALARLDRAINELRCAGTVLVRSGAGKKTFIMAAENATQDGLREFLALSDNNSPSLVITGQRARRLGFTVSDETAAYHVQGFQGLDAELIQGVVNPLSLAAMTPTQQQQIRRLPITPADTTAETIIAMVKHGRLLPAVLTLAVDHMDPAWDLLEIDTHDITQGLQQASSDLQIVAQARVPLEDSENTRIVAFRPRDGGLEHLAIIVGEPDVSQPVLIRIHSECYTGDLVGSLRCDCGPQLRGAIALMASAGSGIVLYMAQEGRGIGLINKLRAYQLQDTGRDTVDANLDLGFEDDERDYLPAVEMLKLLSVAQVRLLTNNPKKVDALSRLGVKVVERVAHVFPANQHNRGYLYTKGSRGGHLFDLSEYVSESSGDD